MAEFREAAFRAEPFSVPVGGGDYPFPVLTARDWLEFFGSRSWVVSTISALPDMAFGRFIDKVESDELDAGDVRTFAHSALAQSAGRPWWEAQRLIGACFNDGGRLLGTVLMRGVDPSRMTLAAFLACVWAKLTENADVTSLAKLESELLVPPPEATEDERAAVDEDVFTMVERMRAMPGVRTG